MDVLLANCSVHLQDSTNQLLKIYNFLRKITVNVISSEVVRFELLLQREVFELCKHKTINWASGKG
jgi:ACT domain-containing protein